MTKINHLVEWVLHRTNTIEALKGAEASWGAEIDIRSSGSQLILHHDPHQKGLLFDEFLAQYASRHREHLLVLNPKEDGLEKEALTLLQKHGIHRFFFLDLAMPTFIRMAIKEKEKRIAVRVSSYEPLESAQAFAGAVEWAWVDCFEGIPPTSQLLDQVKKHFRICLVSPELQGYPLSHIAAFKPLLNQVDAVCTKSPTTWQ